MTLSRELSRSLVALVFALMIMVLSTGCQSGEPDLEEDTILEGLGVLTGQIDSRSVEIELEGQLKTFVLGEGVSVTGIREGSKVLFFYTEEEPVPLILSIETLEEPDPVYEELGIYIGQIDSHSVEIEVGGQARAFQIGEGVEVDHLESGVRVLLTYREDEQRHVLLSIKVLEEPDNGKAVEDHTGEGVLEGQIDAHSVEISIKRVFSLSDSVSAEDIETGSLVAFGFTENGRKAKIYSLEAVDEPLEGRIMHGIVVNKINSSTIEIQYHQAFGLDEGVNVEEINDGDEVVFTYYHGEHRPVLSSIAAK